MEHQQKRWLSLDRESQIRLRDQAEIERRLAHDLSVEALRLDTITAMRRFLDRYGEESFVISLDEAEQFYGKVDLDTELLLAISATEHPADLPVDSSHADRQGTHSLRGSMVARRHETGRGTRRAGQRKAR